MIFIRKQKINKIDFNDLISSSIENKSHKLWAKVRAVRSKKTAGFQENHERI